MDRMYATEIERGNMLWIIAVQDGTGKVDSEDGLKKLRNDV